MNNLVLCLAGMVVAATLAAPAAAQRDKERGDSQFPPSLAAFKSEKCTVWKPGKGWTNPYKSRVNYVAGPNGAEPMTVMIRNMDCRPRPDYWHRWWLLGLRNAAGKTIVPEGYRNMFAISPTAAIVQRLDKSWAIHEGGKERPLPIQPESVTPTDARGPCTEILSNPDGTQGVMVHGPAQNGVRDVAYFHGSSQPAIFRGVLDGVPVRRLGDRLYVNYRDGARAYTLAGVPVTGTLGVITFWQAKLTDGATDTCRRGSPDVMAMGPSLDRDPSRAEYGPMWFPLSETGEFMPLPEGAIGVLPLGRPFNDTAFADLPDGHRDWLSGQWALIYPEQDGWSWSMHVGKLREVLAKADGGRRYRGISRDPASGLIAAIDPQSGKWVVPVEDGYAMAGTPANDPATARASFNAARNAQTAARMAEFHREVAARKAKELADYIVFRDRALAGGKLCIYRAPMNLTIAEISVHAQHCPGTFSDADLVAAVEKGLSADLAQNIRAAWGQQARAQAAALAKREWELANPAPRPYYPGAFGDAIRNAGDAVVAGIQRDKESWFDARRKAYREEWQRKQRAY
ncbi:MAG: hypothetical protein EOP61_11680 [Sphingomonadales bacterium]|nr:MAG: hypothetical protein EOP61_11680 [Sphingomonadales bacterium]